jgi:hypothetical protein
VGGVVRAVREAPKVLAQSPSPRVDCVPPVSLQTFHDRCLLPSLPSLGKVPSARRVLSLRRVPKSEHSSLSCRKDLRLGTD